MLGAARDVDTGAVKGGTTAPPSDFTVSVVIAAGAMVAGLCVVADVG